MGGRSTVFKPIGTELERSLPTISIFLGPSLEGEI
jgi:hypothetical protein